MQQSIQPTRASNTTMIILASSGGWRRRKNKYDPFNGMFSQKLQDIIFCGKRKDKNNYEGLVK